MLTLLAVLALGATDLAASGPPQPAPMAQSFAALAAEQPESVVVDCAVAAEFLSDCRVVGEAGRAGDEALQLAGQIPSSAARPAAVDGRITVRLMVNP